MKAERRHQLQQNSLASALEHLPESVQKYGARALLALVILALVFALIRYRTIAAQDRRQLALDRLATARNMIDQLRSSSLLMMTQEQLANTRRDVFTEAGATLNDIQSDEPPIKAEVLVMKGNLAWFMANTPDLPGATTRPALKFEGDRKQMLDEAQSKYEEVLSKYLDERPAAAAAHFGLAAIAENRHEWETAAQHYSTLIQDPTTASAFRNQATIRIQMLAQIQNPLLAGDDVPTTRPSTRPTTNAVEAVGPMAPVIVPSTQPTN